MRYPVILLVVASCLLIQCRPCQWSGCGCDFRGINNLYIIEQLRAEFKPMLGWDDSISYYPYKQANIEVTINKASLLAHKPSSSWSFIPTAQACDPAVNEKATTYFKDIIVINQKIDTVYGQRWLVGDTITSHFNFGQNYTLRPINEFLATHNSIDRLGRYNLGLKSDPPEYERLQFTIHFVMSDQKVFTFPDMEMRVY